MRRIWLACVVCLLTTASVVASSTAAVNAAPAAPTASFSFSPAAPATGQSVHFNAAASSCAAAPCSYTWADDPPGGGIWPLGSGQTLDFTFHGVGTKYVTLTLTDALNRTASVEHSVVVRAPTAPPSNTALPQLSGTTTQADVLSTSNGTWAGSPTGYTYQWQHCDASGGSCTSISGVTSSGYMLTSSDVGHTMRAVVTASNGGGSTPATSAASAVIASNAPAPPTNTLAPQVSGSAVQGQTLATSNGSWSGAPTGYTYAWSDCDSSGSACTNISGATAASYTLAAGDVGRTIRAIVVASNPGGSAAATSAQTAAVTAALPVAVFAYSPAAPVTGQAVHLNAAASSCTAAPCSYTWADDPPGGGIWPLGSGQTLDFTFQGQGTKYVTLTLTDALNRTASVEHDLLVGAPNGAAPSNTALPQLSGTTTQGQMLSSSTGAWSGSPTSYGYQWQRCNTAGANCGNIGGATSSTYTLASVDVGNTLSVVVTATNSSGSTPASSAASATIGASAPSPPVNTALPTLSGTTTQGQTLTSSNGTWSGSPTSYAYQWRECDSAGANCTNSTGATGSSDQLTSNDVGHTMRAVVTATNPGGSASATSSQTALISSSSGTGVALVGTAGEPNVTCNTTLSAGASVQNALAAASPGQVVCLNAGTWAAQIISGVTPASPGVTLAATPGQSVSIPDLVIQSTTNLTIEGFTFSSSRACTSGAASPYFCSVEGYGSLNNVTFQYNTIQNHAKDYAFEFYPNAAGGSYTETGVRILYNQMDHIGMCLEVAGGSSMNSNFAFNNNVCGPAIGYGVASADTSCCITTAPQHYIQVNGINTMMIDHNAFEGPFDSTALNASPGVHNNVLHMVGGDTNDLTFSNNILWHTQSRGQTLLVEENLNDRISTLNNLDVEDPGCASGATANCPSFAEEVERPHIMTTTNNTFVNSLYGVEYGLSENGGEYASPTGLTLQRNVVAPTQPSGSSNYNHWECTSACTTDHNVSADGSANTLPGTTGNLVNWAPAWQNTAWTPTSGSPWTPPPAGYYVATGAAAAMGYAGTIGPQSSGQSMSAPVNTTLPQISGTTTQGQTLTTTDGTWTNNPTSYAYKWQDCDSSGNTCADIASATADTYTLTATDVNHTIRAIVPATNAGGSTPATAAQTAVIAGTVSAGSQVGTGGEPSVSCTVTISASGATGSSAQNALAGLSPGQTACFGAGSFPQQNLANGLTPASPGISLAAANGASVHVAGLAATAQLTNVTIEGLNMSQQFSFRAGLSNLTLQYNDIENYSCSGDCAAGDAAIYAYPGGVNNGPTADNVKILYNQIDHVPQCLEGDGPVSAFTFSHNVCGPGIGAGGATGAHYIQTSSSGDVIDNNAFLGPFYNNGNTNGLHNNVLHYPGGSSNDEFNNNIIWHTQSAGQTILFDNPGQYSNISVSNNLIVEAPSGGGGQGGYSMDVPDTLAHGFTVQNNTIEHSGYAAGGMYNNSNPGGWSSGQNYNYTNNVVVDHGAGNSDLSVGNCSNTCAFSPNVTSDGSAGGTPNISNWTPSWQSTSWTAPTGAPWSPPPVNYYKPANIAASFGYQGTIGP